MKLLISITVFIFSLQFSLAQEVKVLTWKEYAPVVRPDSGKVMVVNFWATWCAPCIEELPVFERLTEEQSESVSVVLTSLDHQSRLESKLLPFLAKKKIRSKVVLLNEVDFNAWMPKVDASWSGAIPATWLLFNGKQLFHEGRLTYIELLELIKKIKR